MFMRRLKMLAGLSTIAVAGALAASGCGGEGEGAEGAEGARAGKSGKGDHAAHAAGPGEGGEGEGGEGSAKAAGGVQSYVAQMMILRGHLKAGVALYTAGDVAAARVHMKHPHDELYVALAPMFSAYGVEGPDAELAALAASVEGGAPSLDVEAGFQRVSAAVTRAIDVARPSLRDQLLAVAEVVREAGSEFDLAVKDGALVNPKEYQDAYGFLTTALETLGSIEGATPAEKDAVALAREQAALALAAAPTPLPEGAIEAKSATIFGAAARIEIAALGL